MLNFILKLKYILDTVAKLIRKYVSCWMTLRILWGLGLMKTGLSSLLIVSEL